VDPIATDNRTNGTNGQRRGATATQAFGAGRRESHDASEFYARFTPPVIAQDEDVTALPEPALLGLEDWCINGDARYMTQVPDNSIALVATSPPYFVGKEYEQAVVGDRDRLPAIPTTYLDYLQMLRDVFSECVRVLEPGGRIAVNVANLGRKPYRSLAADVINILQDDLGMLLRGEIIWHKAEGATGSLAWGSYRSATNPVLRDITERVIIASKGRFDRAIKPAKRADQGLPNKSTVSADEFMEATLDVWRIDPESARRVGHPAPFPVELPRRLIDLYTFEGDAVLDPFLGSGSTIVAAERTGRVGVGFDLDPDYIELARERVAAERARRRHRPVESAGDEPLPLAVPDTIEERVEHFQARATKEGKKAQDLAKEVLLDAGFEIIDEKVKVKGTGLQLNFEIADRAGEFRYYVDMSGAFTSSRPGLMRTDTLWKMLGRANVLKTTHPDTRLLVLTSHLPRPGSEGDRAMRAVGPWALFDAIEIFDEPQDGALELADSGTAAGVQRLRAYAERGATEPLPGFWTEKDIRDRFSARGA
jgi:site-specific DNA-methyltransferase (adenine-specific)